MFPFTWLTALLREPPSVAAAVQLLTERFDIMFATLTTKTDTLAAKVDELLTSLSAAKARDDIQAKALADTRTEIAALKAVVTPLPVDTSAAEAQIDAVLAKLDTARAEVDALDAPAPVASGTPAAPASTATDPAAPTGADLGGGTPDAA